MAEAALAMGTCGRPSLVLYDYRLGPCPWSACAFEGVSAVTMRFLPSPSGWPCVIAFVRFIVSVAAAAALDPPDILNYCTRWTTDVYVTNSRLNVDTRVWGGRRARLALGKGYKP